MRYGPSWTCSGWRRITASGRMCSWLCVAGVSCSASPFLPGCVSGLEAMAAPGHLCDRVLSEVQGMQSWEPESVVSAAWGQRLLVVTGIMAAGKSTIARLLATQFQRGVHVEADTLQRMIVSGGVWVDQPGEPSGEAACQLRLRLHHLCQLGRSFYSAGFSVVLDDIIIGERWSELQDELDGLPYTLIVLAPSPPIVRQRDLKRDKPAQESGW